MKAVTVTLDGRQFPLVFNGAAMFEVEETFGGVVAMIEAIGVRNKDGFAALCRSVSLLTQQAEAVRRYMGYDATAPVTADELMAVIEPSSIPKLIKAVEIAVAIGYGREVSAGNDEEVDIGLIELQQKKKKS